MPDARLSIDGLPLDVAMALSRLTYAAINFGCAPEDDDEICERAGNRLQLRRDQLVAAIKHAIAHDQAPVLPHGQHIEVPRPAAVEHFLADHPEIVGSAQC